MAEAAHELEALGYRALWIAEGPGFPLLEAAQTLLGLTSEVVVATGILNIWRHEPSEVAAACARLGVLHPGRFVLGLGVSHAQLFGSEQPNPYRRPVATMRAYLDGLAAAVPAVDPRACVLAALGPRMLALARERTAGAHPYLVTPEHTRRARGLLGPDALLAPEQAVVLDANRGRAREVARRHVARYLGLPNYTNNLLTLGFTDGDLAAGGSDRLVDALVACGDVAAIARRVGEHRQAGADHVAVQVLGADADEVPLAALRELAPALV